MTIAEAQKSGGIGKYLIIYLCILAIAALQFVVAYSHIDTSQMILRFLSLAVVEAALAVMFFMHLWTEKRSFLIAVAVVTIFVLLGMQFGWPDSIRMANGAPNSPSTTQIAPATSGQTP